MHRPLALAVILLLLAGDLFAPARAQEATPEVAVASGEAARTVVHYFLPFTGDGLNGELTVRDSTTGTCDAESAAAPGRHDAWTCIGDESGVYDPCFQSPLSSPDEPGALACLSSPFDREVVMLTPDDPLPVEKDNATDGGPPDSMSNDGAALPWAMELADGEQCTIARGATVAFAGMRVNYFCTGGGSLLGEPDRSQPVWVVNYLPDGGLETDAAEVRAVWP